ncbi:hypothetical protein [Mucilaginibacter polytrichastri]|uniref:Uncharacterized protein n=1 Tax=Mucilaginibacter polytrichastri TaxID=1302689 RepID=A0A1Q5ZSU5_9SPHI|nr:hypothetical protein [Mucilaginibacter polytrichastri]OKS84842.1 hypothetical protein RG47T_0279 [Mucilaginibacter polytrichastri]SFS48754.1 hypothetical protein SAMN04487890_101795 [Mucilaginibacter polytrichastri]
MNINLANVLFDDGVFSELYQAGFITEKIFAYREIYLWIHAQLQTRKISKRKAVAEAEVKFNKDARTIWRALHCFTEAEDLLIPVELEDFEY